MKKNLSLLILLPIVLLQNCSQNEDVKPAKSTISFTLSNSGVTNGRQKAAQIDGAVKVLISLQTSDGQPVLTRHPVNLLSFGDSYITESIEIEPGSYKVTDFLLANGDSEVLYAVPQAGSALAGAVKHALPYDFSVADGKVASVEMQVISVDEYSPEDFGYVTFGVEEVLPLTVSVFIPQNGQLRLTSATAYLTHNGAVVQTLPLKAKVNVVGLQGKSDETYTLTIVKDGFAPYYKEFVHDDLVEALNGSTLPVYLKPALTLRIRHNGMGPEDFYLNLEMKQATALMINWGDSTQTVHNFPDLNDYIPAIHEYPNIARAEYFVTVTGPLDQIARFVAQTGYTYLSVTTRNLSELQAVNFFISAPPAIDLRENHKLVSVQLQSVKSVQLPDVSTIKVLSIDGNDALAPQIDYLIDNLYRNASTEGGSFSFTKSVYGIGNEMIAVPSPESMQKLNFLKINLNYTIKPDPF